MNNMKGLPIGFVNRASNCYFNTAIQVILCIPLLTREIIQLAPIDPVIASLQQLIMEIFTQKHQICDTLPLLRELSKIVQFGPIGRQYDAGEFFIYIVKHLEEKFPTRIKPMVCGEHVRTRTCVCGDISTTNSDFINLILNTQTQRPSRHLGSLIRKTLETSHIESFNCDQCKKKTRATISWRISRLPSILTLTTAREVLIEPPKKILKFPEFNNDKYYLSSIIMHSGSATSGHYYAFVNWGDTWYKVDDTTVKEIKLDDYNADIISMSCQYVYICR